MPPRPVEPTIGRMSAVASRIVVGYDGSEAARRALDRAAQLAGYGTTVTVVSVAPSVYAQGLPPIADPDDAAWTRALLDEARDRLTLRHVPVHTRDAIGEPAAVIIETADELQADLIVMGTRNGNALKRFVLGSTSTKVLQNAHSDVLVVR
jgi:nucleotide-binding universal stress UspA family protein